MNTASNSSCKILPLMLFHNNLMAGVVILYINIPS
jgi:hypothetical protein